MSADKNSFYFNPRPRKEGDIERLNELFSGDISIHALVKRATFRYGKGGFTMIISIHALVKRATDRQTAKKIIYIFQSTPS